MNAGVVWFPSNRPNYSLHNMRQYDVEVENYFVIYFNRITVRSTVLLTLIRTSSEYHMTDLYVNNCIPVCALKLHFSAFLVHLGINLGPVSICHLQADFLFCTHEPCPTVLRVFFTGV